MAKAKVYEPSRVVEQAIQSASETAVMILRIDDVISSKSTGPWVARTSMQWTCDPTLHLSSAI